MGDGGAHPRPLPRPGAGQRGQGGVDPQALDPAGEEPPGGQRLQHARPGQLAHPQPGPPLALGLAPVGAVLVGHPEQADPPAGVEALVERRLLAPVGVLEQVVLKLVEQLEADQPPGDGRPVAEAAEAQPAGAGMVEAGQAVVAGALQPAPEPADGGGGAQRVGEALAVPDVHVALGGMGPLEPVQGHELPVGVGRLGQGDGLPPGPAVDPGPAGRLEPVQEDRRPAAVVGQGGHVQPRRPHRREGQPRVPGPVRQPGAVVEVGVGQPPPGEQPRRPARPPGVGQLQAFGWRPHGTTISRARG